MLPPRAMGTITRIAEKGSYAVNVSNLFVVNFAFQSTHESLQDVVLETEFDGKTTQHTLMQVWPVRAPRPVAEKQTADYPLVTGQRILDALFPCVYSVPTSISLTESNSKAVYRVERQLFQVLSVVARRSFHKQSPNIRTRTL